MNGSVGGVGGDGQAGVGGGKYRVILFGTTHPPTEPWIIFLSSSLSFSIRLIPLCPLFSLHLHG